MLSINRPFLPLQTLVFVLMAFVARSQSSNYEHIDDNDLSTVTGPSLSSGWTDFDNDGHEDIFVFNYANRRNFLFRNLGNNTFENYGSDAIVTDLNDSYGGSWADYNNDGFVDLFVSNHNGTNFLYRNNGSGYANGNGFTKITTGDLVTDVTPDAWDASWADYNNDGLVDVVINTNNKSFLYKNLGNDQFEKITTGNLVNDNQSSFSSAWGDYNNDGFMDLFVVTYGNQNNALYRNNGDGTFQKIVTGAIVNDGGQSRSACWGDYNNDGHLDLYVTNSGQPNFLYRNNGNSTFTKITDDPITVEEYWSYSSTWTDFNNDGYLDMAVVNSTSNDSVSLFRNNKNGTFTRVRDQSLLPAGTSSWSLSAADYNNDGYEDLYVAGRGNNKGYLYKNINSGNHFLGIKLKGEQSNASGIGARIRVKANGFWQTRQVTSKSGRGQGSYKLTFGMDQASAADSIVIYWPGGTRQILLNTSTNQSLVVEECTPYHREEQRAICDNESFLFANLSLITAGDYAHTFLSRQGCDSTVLLTLSVHPTFVLQKEHELVYGDQLQFGSQTIRKVGVYEGVFQTIHGCDSTVTMTVTMEPYVGTETTTLCEGESFLFVDDALSQAGTFVKTFVSPSNGRDSVVTLNLVVNPIYDLQSDKKFLCEGEAFEFGGIQRSLPGTYTHTFKTIHGCDSTVHIDVDVITIDKGITQQGLTFTSNQNDATYQWLSSGVPIPQAIERSFTTTVTGEYSLIITRSTAGVTCTMTSDTVKIVVTSAEEFDSGIDLYPNPVQQGGQLFISIPADGSEGIRVDILSGIGHLVQTETLVNSGEGVRINLKPSVVPGFYLIRMTTTKARWLRKLEIK